MIQTNQLQKVKAVSIVDYLQSIGHEPVKNTGVQLVYLSPFRTENSPSFFVNPTSNVFKDFGTNEGGDIIRLVRALHGYTFPQAVEILERFAPSKPDSFSFSGKTEKPIAKENVLSVTDILPLTHGGLWQYVKGRKISETTAKTYLKEIHYKHGRKRGFSLGFENDRGGFELRNPYWKSSTSPKGITTIEVPNSEIVNVFEGFFDFLSACEYFQYLRPRNTTIILNSLVHLPSVLERLKTAKQVGTYLDNDDAGRNGVETIKSTGVKVCDCSAKYYKQHKDFNAFICS